MFVTTKEETGQEVKERGGRKKGWRHKEDHVPKGLAGAVAILRELI